MNAIQHDLHRKWGGIVPSLAMDAHKDSITGCVDSSLTNAGIQSVHDIDVVAVTRGPGLEICLRIGCEKAQV